METLTPELHEQLVATLRQADHHYYNLDDPLMTNGEYDALVARFEKATGQKWEVLGKPTGKKLKKVKHRTPMRSQEKVRTIEEVRAFRKRVNYFNEQLAASSKLDGLAISVIYENGRLVRVVTRGDGEVGEDITHNMKTRVPGMIFDASIEEVRGEAIIRPSGLEAINARILEDGGDEEDLFANPRNAVSGIVRRDKSADEFELSFVEFFAYGLPGSTRETYIEDMAHLNELGFQVTPCWAFDHAQHIFGNDTAFGSQEGLLAQMEAFRHPEFDLPIDGVIIRFNNNRTHDDLGSTSHHPLGSVAFKFPDEIKRTRITAVRWQVGRTGVLTPVVEFETVQLEGTRVGKATGCNLARLIKYGLNVGVEIGVRKAGMIIPEALAIHGERYICEDAATGQLFYVDTNEDVEDFTPPPTNWPSRCPSCDGETTWKNPHLLCENDSCPPKLIQLLIYHANRDHLDIRGLGKEVAKALVAAGRVKTLVDLYRQDINSLASLPLGNGQVLGTKRANQILEGIQKAINVPFVKAFHSLGCPGLGTPEIESLEAAQLGLPTLLAQRKHPELPTLLQALNGIGPKTADALIKWLQRNSEWLDTIPVYIQLVPEVKEKGDQPLAGITVVITGKFDRGRTEIADDLKALGAKVSGSVSKKTTYLLMGEGEEGSNKHKDALANNIPILGADGLAQLLQGVLP